MSFLNFIMHNPEIIVITVLTVVVAAFYVFSPRHLEKNNDLA